MPLHVSTVLLVASDSPLDPPPDAGAAAPWHWPRWRLLHHIDLWHNIPVVAVALRRALCGLVDAVLSPLAGV